MFQYMKKKTILSVNCLLNYIPKDTSLQVYAFYKLKYTSNKVN